jgi:hypothetical protein
MCGSAATRSSNAAVSRDLPMPGSPESSTIIEVDRVAGEHFGVFGKTKLGQPRSDVARVRHHLLQLSQKRLRVHEVRCIEALREPMVDRSKKIAGLNQYVAF